MRVDSGSDAGAWSATQGNVEFWNFGRGYAGRAVDLNGYPNVLGGIETTETCSFAANSSYVLSFQLGNNQGHHDNGVEYGFQNDNGILA